MNVRPFSSVLAKLVCLIMLAFSARADDRLIGVWMYDEVWQVTELLFRSDGRYLLETRSAEAPAKVTFSEHGSYAVSGTELHLAPHEYLGEKLSRIYGFYTAGGLLSLTRTDFELPEVIYQFKAGSREDVRAREQVEKDLTGSWGREIIFWGREEYTFRPDGYYFVISTPVDNQFPPEIIRGRYTVEGSRVLLTPYSGIEVSRELDFFGNTLTLIRSESTYGDSTTLAEVAGSEETVRAKTAQANAFISAENWQVGVWKLRSSYQSGDLIFRPDGYYIWKETTEGYEGIVRGAYRLEGRRIHLSPFIGQDIYARSNGDFGKVERTREIDFYDGELQIIDLTALSQSVALARLEAGSPAAVLDKILAAQLERQREGWQVGVWEVIDPSGWMEFTFRPDHRYIAKAGTTTGNPGQVERGQYKLAGGKMTLAPYTGLGPARGFQLDLYDGDLFLIGDSYRMVIARKTPGSEAPVMQKTVDPEAMKGERGGILGRWTADMPGLFEELVFRPDGHFRLNRCDNIVSQDYGLYTVNMAERTVVYDSRFTMAQTLGLDFYGDTLTLHGGVQSPRTYKVNLGTVDASIQASHAQDAAEAQVDEQWLARIGVGPRNPNAPSGGVGNLPPDPLPDLVFESPAVFASFQLYRRLIPGFVYYNVNGSIRSVAVTDTREWHFFQNGRVLIRFRNYSAGIWPNTIETVSDSWGAYRIGEKPIQQDILHAFADNTLMIQTDLGEVSEMTFEDGRRRLFWGKNYQLQHEWAAEQKNVPCQLPPNSDANLINLAVSLSTTIPADPIGEVRPMTLAISRPAGGVFSVTGTASAGGTVIVEAATSLGGPLNWQPMQTNTVAAGPFALTVSQGVNKARYFRARAQ